MLPEIDGALARLKAHEHDPQTYENGQAYWDDYALVHFLEGVCMRYIAYAVIVHDLSCALGCSFCAVV